MIAGKDVLRVAVLGALLMGPVAGGAAEADRARQLESEMARMHRAGHPQSVAWYAIPSLNQHYSAGYVGGVAAVHGQPRRLDEGTWGLDYSGIAFPKRIWLRWWHGRHAQGGGGAYETDGPRLTPH